MPNTRPLSDLRNKTTEIAALAHAGQEPVFITKNGCAYLVVMSAEMYERQLSRLEEYDNTASRAEGQSGARLLPLDEMLGG